MYEHEFVQESKKVHLKQLADELVPWLAHYEKIEEYDQDLTKKSKKPLMEIPSIRWHWETARFRSEHICESWHERRK